MSQAAPNLADLKERIQGADEALAARLWDGEDVDVLVRERARFIDTLLGDLWQHYFEGNNAVALVAVGGYGRGELHPKSDIDLLILVKRMRGNHETLEHFLRLLWDIGLDVGHSVRTPSICKQEARGDLSIATALMERRHLAGNEVLTRKLDKIFTSRSVWPSPAFYAAKKEEQDERHEQFNDVDYDLEPNIKGSPGGLRDIQVVGWIAKRHLGTSDTDALIRDGFLTEQEGAWLSAGREFLWKVRYGLHLVAGRAEDRLLFDHQRELARRFGYEDSDGQLAVERFMGDYYRHVLLLREVNDIILQHFDEMILQAKKKPVIEPINDRFRLHNHYIETVDETVFRNHPPALMELFVLMSTNDSIRGVRAATIRRVRDSLDLIDDDFRGNPEVTGLFLDLLRAPHTLVSQLTRMRRYGVLGRYIPEFGQVIGQMQHDLFHIYTVDAHTMMVIRQMRRFHYESSREMFPVASEIIHTLPKIELLYIAGLFHDIGKGRGGDHSELGATDVEQFCRRHGLSDYDTNLVSWLVRHHLDMSTTAQRKDIHDPDVVNEFSGMVGNTIRLDYLYVLTVADINGTNPNLWNSWRATLLRQLYTETRFVLERGDLRTKEEQIIARRVETMALLESGGMARQAVLDIWSDAWDEFFLQHTTEQTAALTRTVYAHDASTGPFVDILTPGEQYAAEGASEVVAYAPDRDHLFAESVAALGHLRLRVVAARIATGVDGMCFNSFIVLGPDGGSIEESDHDRQHVIDTLRAAVAGQWQRRNTRVRVPRRLKQFSVATEVVLTNDVGDDASHLRVVASDRPGLLAALGQLFLELDIKVRRARITTLGERVEDVFEIADRNDERIEDEAAIAKITDTIRTRIDTELSEQA